MKKLLCAILTLILAMSLTAAVAQELEIPVVEWEFPVPLTDIQSKYALLVNADNLLDENFVPEPLVKVNNSQVRLYSRVNMELEQEAYNAIKEMFDAALMVDSYVYTNESGKVKTAEYPDGMVLVLKSAYRKYATQATTYANYIARNKVDDGYVAKPGASEHQTGLCADILNLDYSKRSRMTQDFKWTPEAQWMKANCADFGLILRFTENGEAATGIKFEPWHFRYVGKSMAEYIMGKGITLEEFTVAAQEAYDDFVSRGGDVEEWLKYEDQKLNRPPVSYVLDTCDEDGDAEISLVF